MFGLAILLISALLLVLLVLTIVMVREATHPPRRTAAYAVARGLPVDPGEMRLEYDEWLLDRPDGSRLPVWEIQGRSEAAGRLTVVFVHGWGHSRIDSLSRIEPWLAWCYRVVLYDLRGHGESSDHITHLGHGEDDDLLALLEHLRAERDDQFILVGHSMGAVIAITAAVRGSELKSTIAGVIAYGPYMDFHSSLRGRLRAHGYPTRPITDLMLAWLTMRGRRPLSLGDDMANVRCPLFVVHGTNDAVSPMADAHRIVELAPQARLREVEGAVHSDPLLFSHSDHLEELAAFFDEVTYRSDAN
jgi:pimeloyl-ACP methyl ester carboxylesterase